MFNSEHFPMSACCEKSLLRSHYFDGTFSTNLGTNGVCNLFVGTSASGSFVLAYFSSIGSIAPLSTYSRVHLSLKSTYLVRPLNATLETAWVVRRLPQNQGILFSAISISPRMPLIKPYGAHHAPLLATLPLMLIFQLTFAILISTRLVIHR